MAEPFQVDPDALADAVERMAEFQRYAENVLSEIDSLVSNLHATWTGEGAAAHAEAHRQWARGEAMMRERWLNCEQPPIPRTATTPAQCQRISPCGRDLVRCAGAASPARARRVKPRHTSAG
jgi:hypothetical protein